MYWVFSHRPIQFKEDLFRIERTTLYNEDSSFEC